MLNLGQSMQPKRDLGNDISYASPLHASLFFKTTVSLKLLVKLTQDKISHSHKFKSHKFDLKSDLLLSQEK